MASRDVLLEKINRKQELEAELKEQMEILRTNEVDLTGALVDAEDYPRGDIDLYKVRTARQRISCLQNDLNELMKEITVGLEEHFSGLKVDTPKETKDNETSGKKSPEDIAPEPVNKEPFAIIDAVTEGSPADACGLRVKDEIIEFGSLTAKNFEKLQQFAEIAQHKLDQKVAVLVKRKRENGSASFDTIPLVPKKWSGRGYLGMVVRPINRL